MKRLPWILAAAAVAVLAGVVILLQDTGAPERGGDTTELVDASGAAPTPAAGTTLPAHPAARPLPLPATDVEPPDEPDEEAMPASYRRALGGIVGRVVEADGSPVPDLGVALLGGGALSFRPDPAALLAGELPELKLRQAEAITDAQGRFRLEDVEPRILGALLVDPGGPRATLRVLEQTAATGETRDVGDIVLAPGVTLRGRVLDERREPVVGARVRATDLPSIALGSGIADWRAGGGFHLADGETDFTYVPPPSLSRLEEILPFPTTTTDAEGGFELPGVPIGLVTVVVDEPGHPVLVHGPNPTGATGADQDLGELVLSDGVELTGRVVDARGEPVAGAQVMGGNQMSLAPVGILRPAVTTDEQGHFQVPGLKPALAHAVARRDESHAFVAGEPLVAGAGEMTITLPVPATLTVEVVDPAGAAVPDVHLLGRQVPEDDVNAMLDYFMPARSLDGRTTLDEQGRHVVAGLEPGNWQIVVGADGFGVAREMAVIPEGGGDTRLHVALEPEHVLRVSVVRKADGEPVEWATVTARPEDGNFEDTLSSARTDARGVALLGHLPDGSLTLEVEHPGLAVTATTAVVPDDEEVVVELEPGGTVLGTVLDAGGPPAEPLLVTLTRADEDRARRLPGSALPRLALTDADGRFRFTNVEPGEVQLQARDRFQFTSLTTWWEPFAMTPQAEGEAWVTAGEESELVLVVGSPYEDVETGFVSGRLTVNGWPAADWHVRTWGEIRRSVTVEQDGSFHLGRLAAGEVTLMFTPPGAGLMDGAATDVSTFELATDEQRFVEIALETGSITGKVLEERTGAPVAGASVILRSTADEGRWWGRRGGVTVTQADGSFLIEPVAEGEYSLMAQAEGYADVRGEPFSVEGRLPSRGHVLRLPAPVHVQGRVVFSVADADPDWIWLTAESEDGNEAAARVDATTGSFVIDDLAPGTWTFTVHAGLDTEFASTTVPIQVDRPDLVLTFEPVPPEPPDEDAVKALQALGYMSDDDN